MVAGLVLVAVAAIVVPAIAVDSKPGRGWLDVSKIATASRVKAHHALGQARKAKKLANRALRLAQQVPSGGTTGAAPATAFAEASATVTTSDASQYVSLGGPSVKVNVPVNASGGTGLLAVAAQAHIDDDAGAVALFQDGSPMSGQSDVCDQITGTPGPPLFTSTDGLGGTWGTPASIDTLGNCGSTGPAAPVMFTTSPGEHTYELRYAYCGCSGTDATFSQRRLWVTPLG
jgi:hypothetical protein